MKMRYMINQLYKNTSYMLHRVPQADFVTSLPSEYILGLNINIYGTCLTPLKRSADSYHTLNALAGLSSAQHYVAQSHDLHEKLVHDWIPQSGESSPSRSLFICVYGTLFPNPSFFTGGLLDNAALDDMRKVAYAEARSWREEPTKSKYLGGAGERLVKQFLSLYPISYSDEMRVPGGDVTPIL